MIEYAANHRFGEIRATPDGIEAFIAASSGVSVAEVRAGRAKAKLRRELPGLLAKSGILEQTMASALRDARQVVDDLAQPAGDRREAQAVIDEFGPELDRLIEGDLLLMRAVD